MPFAILILVFLLLASPVVCQPSAIGQLRNDAKIERELRAALAGFQGDAGIYVRNLRTGKGVVINADTLFPTASTIKIPIQCGLFAKIHQGELTYQQELTYQDSLHYDDGIVGSLKNEAKIPLSQVVMLMETISDNTGSLWCQALAGGGLAINTWLETNGFHKTRVNSRTPGREANRTRYGWGQTTPRELAELLVYIREGKAVSSDASEEMYRNLGRQFWDSHGLSQVPPNVKVVTKNGAVDQSRSEVVLVEAPHGAYVYCVMTKNQRDTSWQRNNEGFTLLRNVAAILWKHFEPKSDWKPSEGYEKWY
ncbi:hypothetical protein GCM10027592_16620 [Spirosoma flavus]